MQIKQLFEIYESQLIITHQIELIRRTYVQKTSDFYYTIKTQKCKSIQEAVLQKANDTFINVSNPNDVYKATDRYRSKKCNASFKFSIEKILKPIAQCFKTYIKDDWYFIKQLIRTLNYEKRYIYVTQKAYTHSYTYT